MIEYHWVDANMIRCWHEEMPDMGSGHVLWCHEEMLIIQWGDVDIYDMKRFRYEKILIL